MISIECKDLDNVICLRQFSSRSRHCDLSLVFRFQLYSTVLYRFSKKQKHVYGHDITDDITFLYTLFGLTE